jgi:hypothetical protein
MSTSDAKNPNTTRRLGQASSSYYLSDELLQALDGIEQVVTYTDLHALPQTQPEVLADNTAELTTLEQLPTDCLPAVIVENEESCTRMQITSGSERSLSIHIASPYDFLLRPPDPFNQHDVGTDFPESRSVYLRVLGLSNDEHQTHDQGNERVLAHWFLRKQPTYRPPWAAPSLRRPEDDGSIQPHR